MRLTEEGRELLKNDDYDKGLSKLEKALAIDSTNPYAYYYLAQAHHLLTHYTESLNFLEVTEGRFTQEPSWQARVLVFKGENFRALGLLEKADENYAGALKLDPTHPVALERMIHISGEPPAALP
ncbi:MAG: tetratricopeptide repeat protein [Deltaproteobacteria bacterium]|nr:tetratricopeptide repeat protein [Deltaproteobacteria bacterium]